MQMKKKNFSTKELYKVLFVCDKINIVPILWGSPGIGKSSIVTKYSNKLYNSDPIVLIGSTLDPTDIVGHFRVNDKEKITEHYPPYWYMELINNKKKVLFFDELPNSPELVQATMLRIINEKAILDKKLPSDTFIIAAGNAPSQSPSAIPLSLAMETRLMHIHVDVKFSDVMESFITGFQDEPEIIENYKEKLVEANVPIAKSVIVNYLSDHYNKIDYESDGESGAVNLRTADKSSYVLAFHMAYPKYLNASLTRKMLGGMLGNIGYGVLDYLDKLRLPDVDTILKKGNEIFNEYTGAAYSIITKVFNEFVTNDDRKQDIIDFMIEARNYDFAYLVIFLRLLRKYDKKLFKKVVLDDDKFYNVVVDVVNKIN